MLQWFVKNKAILEEVIIQKRLIQLQDVFADFEKVPMKCLDENITLSRIRKYFKDDAWKLVQELVDYKKECSIWYCPVCSNDLDGEQSIECDACLNWYHLHCAGLSTIPKKKIWICRNCYKLD